MAVRFSDEQVQEATSATRVRQGARASYSAVCTDSRAIVPGSLFVALKGESFDAHDFVQQAVDAGAAGVLVERPVTLKQEDVAVYQVAGSTLTALGRLANYHRNRFRIPIGAVTGSNGKTTTKELIGAILETRGPALKTQGNLNNEIGVPLTLFGLEPKHVSAIVEMGMNHAGEISRLADIARPDAGVITVVQPAHLEGLGSIEGVANAKGELFRGLAPGATAVVNLDDERVAAQSRGIAAKILTFGRSANAEVRLDSVTPVGLEALDLVIVYRGRSWPVRLQLIGEHNATNATAAFALALALGYQPEECVKGLSAAKSHTRRLQVLAGQGGVTVIDDCYNANPASMGAALRTLQSLANGRRTLAVLGDMLELGKGELADHAQMGTLAAGLAKQLVLFGPRMKAAYETAKQAGAAVHHFDDIEQLKAFVQSEKKTGDVVLVKASRGMRLERVVEALTGQTQGGGH